MIMILIIISQVIQVVISGEIAPAFYGLDRPALEYELPPLQYSFDEFEPYIDEATVRVHYFEYHAKYIEEVNVILKGWRRNAIKGKHASRLSIIDILRNLSHIPSKYRTHLRNCGSGFINHNFYWATMTPNPQGEHRVPGGQLVDDITSKFGSFLEFKATFTDMANNLFGSGFVWLCRNHSTPESLGDLVITTIQNEESPLSGGLYPILGIDVWEHAYLLKLHNQRSKYVENWWFLVDWMQVAKLDDWWKHLKLHDEL